MTLDYLAVFKLQLFQYQRYVLYRHPCGYNV